LKADKLGEPLADWSDDWLVAGLAVNLGKLTVGDLDDKLAKRLVCRKVELMDGIGVAATDGLLGWAMVDVMVNY
jgi:hypothetical protein